MASQPQLAEEVMPWLSTQARSVLNSYLSAPPKTVIDSTDNSQMPEILVSPPWRSKKKMTVPRLDLAPFELTPQVYWQPVNERGLPPLSLPVISARNLLRNAWNIKVDELYYRSWVLEMMYGCF